MNPPYLPLFTALVMASVMTLAVLQPAHAGNDFGAKAQVRMKQVYDRHGGQQQALEALQPIADKKTRTCRICHGDNGNSSRGVLPSLAGERPEYLLKRWYELKDGHGESTTATRMAKRIDEEEMIALALFYADQKREPAKYVPDLASSGAEAYKSTCQGCHLADGRGTEIMPIIAGQQPEYMNRTMLQYRDKNGWREHSDMAPQPTKLSPIQIKAATHYAASLGQ